METLDKYDVQILTELQADARPVGDLSGINYSRGRRVHVTLYRVGQLRDLN